MGYEVTRFIGNISQEFQCSICKMVMEEPMQSSCDHLFCKQCIKGWLAAVSSCPIDSRFLTFDDFRPAVRFFSNMLNELQIKCDFQPDGCKLVVRLEHLKTHLTSCEYNPNIPVVCDKGCYLRMTRRECQANNCIIHLTDCLRLYQEDNVNMRHEISAQKEHIERLKQEKTKLCEQMGVQKTQLSDRLRLYEEENQKLRKHMEHFEWLVQRLKEKNTKLREEMHTFKKTNVAEFK